VLLVTVLLAVVAVALLAVVAVALLAVVAVAPDALASTMTASPMLAVIMTF
jgi:hypothetical protein